MSSGLRCLWLLSFCVGCAELPRFASTSALTEASTVSVSKPANAEQLPEWSPVGLAALGIRVGQPCVIKIEAEQSVNILNQEDGITKPAEDQLGVRDRCTGGGRIVAIDDDALVLSEIVMPMARVTEPKSRFQRVPYINRLYKNTGVMTVRQISGERRIPWAMLVSISPQSEASWKQYQQSGLERIGVDFDLQSGTPGQLQPVEPNLMATMFCNGSPLFTRDSLITLKKFKNENAVP